MNEAKLHEFMGRLVNDMGGAAMMASVIVGEELGLYRAMADGSPVTPDELASKTGCNPRLTREWLNAQAASGGRGSVAILQGCKRRVGFKPAYSATLA